MGGYWRGDGRRVGVKGQELKRRAAGDGEKVGPGNEGEGLDGLMAGGERFEVDLGDGARGVVER